MKASKIMKVIVYLLMTTSIIVIFLMLLFPFESNLIQYKFITINLSIFFVYAGVWSYLDSIIKYHESFTDYDRQRWLKEKQFAIYGMYASFLIFICILISI